MFHTAKTALSTLAFVAAILLLLIPVMSVKAADLRTPAVFAVGEDGFVYASLALGSPSYYIDLNRPKRPDQYKIKNNTNGKIVVTLYRGTDKLSAVPFKRFSMEKSSTASFDAQVVHVKVFKPALIDKHKKTVKSISSDVVITGTPDNPTVKASGPKPLRVKNNTEMRVKVCIYNKNDLVKAIPKKAWFLEPGKHLTWDTSQSEFLVRVFKPELLDRALVDRVAQPGDILGIDQSDMTRWQRVGSKPVPGDGPIQVSSSPKNNGAGFYMYEVVTRDQQGRAFSMGCRLDYKKDKVSASGWSSLADFVGEKQNKHDIPPQFVFHGKKSAGGKLNTAAIAYCVVDGKIQFRRVWNREAFKQTMNKGPWTVTTHKTSVPFTVLTLKQPKLYYVTDSGTLMRSEYNEKENDYTSLSAVASNVSLTTPAIDYRLSDGDTDKPMIDVYFVRDKKIYCKTRDLSKGTGLPEKTLPPTLPDDHRWTDVAVLSESRRAFLGVAGKHKSTTWLVARSTDGFMYSNKREPGEDWGEWKLIDGLKFKTGPTETILLN